jgi:hypothetical protein
MPDRPEEQDPDVDRVQDRAEQRKHERAEHAESIIEHAEATLGDHEYPVTSEELAAAYADEPLDLPNETESLGSVFDRLVDERFDSPDEAREALYHELTGSAGTDAEYNDERPLEDLDEATGDDLTESGGSGL